MMNELANESQDTAPLALPMLTESIITDSFLK
jgi:hypothetical protein